MDILFTKRNPLDNLVSDLLQYGQELEQLSLEFAHPNNADNIMSQLEVRRANTRLPKLKHLSLRNLCVGKLYDGLSQIVAFERLTGLTLYECTDPDQFFAEMGSALLSVELSLERIVASVTTFHCLRNVAGRSSALTALHISANSTSESSDQDLDSWLEIVVRQGKRLDSLSINCTEKEYDSFTVDGDVFWTLCYHCPNLRQLGLQISELNAVEIGDTFYTLCEHLVCHIEEIHPAASTDST
jgi:hypothetical protein